MRQCAQHVQYEVIKSNQKGWTWLFPQIVDCFSRLTREIKEAEHYSLCDTILADHDKIETKTGFSVKAIRNSKAPTEDDPWVEHLGNVAMSDRDYGAPP